MAVSIVYLHSRAYEYLAAALAAAGVPTVEATDVAEAGASEAALILMAATPDELGFVAELRARHPATPQLAVIDHDDVDLRLAAYEAGADDCVSRPFHLRELVAKLNALRRRRMRDSVVQLLPGADAAVDLIASELKVADRSRNLTRREADLVALLARAGGGAVRREDVLRDAWGAAPGLTGNLVDVYVGQVRRKLSQLGADVTIKSVRGEGFRVSGLPAPFRRQSSPPAKPEPALFIE
ncbi:response regulator transcription factor [Methylopila sp. M107]|uniref:response regulator transcription factor n=1 Tax=Methylopila sp. M107 TaxID=1101190 RepID=UPI00036DC624|nr:response regulator transcription factor [Methylopila sp. M107]